MKYHFRNRQSKPHSTSINLFGVRDFPEELEKLADFFLHDPDSRVYDLSNKFSIQEVHPNVDGSAKCELDRISHQVKHYLFEPFLIGLDLYRHSLAYLHIEL